MRHYVMTRSSYGPEWDIEANRRRLKITEAVTAELLAKQTCDDFDWVVLLDERDPLWTARVELMQDAVGDRAKPIFWVPRLTEPAPWDKAKRHTEAQKVAATAYRHSGWNRVVGPRDEQVLMTRLDDDDGLAPDAIRRFQRAAKGLTERTALMMPNGIRVWDGHYARVRHTSNAMHTLSTPVGDETCVYDYGHRLVDRGQPVKTVDEHVGWLWLRHDDTISGWKVADRRLTRAIRDLFPIDWSAIT